MSRQDIDSQFLLSDDGKRIVGMKNPDGSETSLVAPVAAVKASQSQTICDWTPESGSGGSAGGTGAIDPTVLNNGLPALKCTFAASSTFVYTHTLSNPISLRNWRSVSVAVRNTSNVAASGPLGQGGANFQIWLSANAGAKSLRLQCNGSGWFEVQKEFNVYSWCRDDSDKYLLSNSTLGEYDTLAIDQVIVVTVTNATSASYPIWLGPIKVDCGTDTDKGLVSWTFDGEYVEQLPLLALTKKYSIPISMALINQNIGLAGQLSKAQLNEFYADGHDFIHHTFVNNKTNGYVNATDWPTSASIAEDIRLQWDSFKTNGWLRGLGVGVMAFAESFDGNAVTETRQKLIRDGLISGGMKLMRGGVVDTRKTMPGYGDYGKLPTVLSKKSLRFDTTLPQLTALIDSCALNKHHISFYGHYLGTNPVSGNVIDTTVLEGAMAYAAANSNVVNIKLADTLALYR